MVINIMVYVAMQCTAMIRLVIVAATVFGLTPDLTRRDDDTETEVVTKFISHLLKEVGCNTRLYHDFDTIPDSLLRFIRDVAPIELHDVQSMPDVTLRTAYTDQVHNFLPRWKCPRKLDKHVPPPPQPEGGSCVLHAVLADSGGVQKVVSTLMYLSTARTGQSVQLDHHMLLVWNRDGRLEVADDMRFKLYRQIKLQHDRIQLYGIGCNDTSLHNVCNLTTGFEQCEPVFARPACKFNGAALQILVLVPFGGKSGRARSSISETHPFYTPPHVVRSVASILDFTPNMTYGGLHYYFHTYRNGTCEGYAGFLYDQSYDVIFHVGLPQILGTYDRVELTIPYFHDHYTFYVLNPRVLYPWNSFMQPLRGEVWFALVGAYVSACTVLWLAKRVVSPGEPISRCFQDILGLILEQSVKTPKAAVLRLFFAVFFVSFLIVVWGYKGRLVAYLTMPRREWIPRTFQDLSESDYSWVFFGNIFRDGLAEYAALPTVKTFRAILPRIDTAFVLVDDDITCIGSCMASPKNACVGTRFFMDQTVQKLYSDRLGDHLLTHSDEQLFMFGYAAVTSRKWPYSHLLAQGVSRLWETGVIPFLYTTMKRDTWFYSRQGNVTKALNSSLVNEYACDRPIKWDMVEGVFGILLSGYLLGFVVILAELARSSINKKAMHGEQDMYQYVP